jgi:nucleoside-diphosphate-sugar epimerase
MIGSGRNRVAFAHVNDAVQGLLLVLEHDSVEGQIYNIVDDRCPTQEVPLQEIAEQLGASMPRIHVPYWLLYSAALVAERVAQVTRSPHPLVTRFGLLLYVRADNCFAIGKARHRLGYEPRVPLRGACASQRRRIASVLPRPEISVLQPWWLQPRELDT